METRYRVKRGDRPGFLRGTCADADGPVNIQAALEVRVLARKRDTAVLKLNVLATVLDDGTPANRGRWEYRWADADLDTAGNYELEVQVTWPSNERITFPTYGYAELIVESDLG